MSKKLRLVVLSMMGRCPFGGQTLLSLNWLRGLAALGHEVWYVEDDSVWPYHPEKNSITNDAPTPCNTPPGAWTGLACQGSGRSVWRAGKGRAGECLPPG
jgi:hypothetical protein